MRLAAENDRLHEECALLREELRLKGARLTQIPPQHRRQLLSLCFDARQVALLNYLQCEDTDYLKHRLANCQASMGANIRWTMTPDPGISTLCAC